MKAFLKIMAASAVYLVAWQLADDVIDKYIYTNDKKKGDKK